MVDAFALNGECESSIEELNLETRDRIMESEIVSIVDFHPPMEVLELVMFMLILLYIYLAMNWASR